MEFTNSKNSSSVLQGLNKLRKENQFCDVILKTSDGSSFPAHKNVLSVCSPFFEVMFNGSFPESCQKEVLLYEMEGEIFEILLEYMYSGRLKVTHDNVQDLLSKSCFLQIEWVQGKCCDFLREYLEPSNCLGIRYFAENHSLTDLAQAATTFSARNFNQVSKESEFLALKIEILTELLSNDEILDHEDDVVFTGIMAWVNHSPQNRLSFLPDLLKFVHPLLVNKNIIVKNASMMKDPLSSNWVTRALDPYQHSSEWNIFILDRIGRSSNLFRYGLDARKLVPLTTFPEKTFAISVAAHKHSLFVQGGAIKRKSIRDCYRYSIYRDRWIPFKPLQVGRSHHRSLILNNFLYTIGGNGNDCFLADVECVDLETGQSMTVEPLLEERSSMGAVVHENCLYVMGGENRECLFSVERFDPREGKWTELEAMNQINSYCSSSAVGQVIYCSEGFGNFMEFYDIRSNQWHIIDFQKDWEFYELFSIGNDLYNISSDGIHRYGPHINDWLKVIEFPYKHEWDTAVPLQMKVL